MKKAYIALLLLALIIVNFIINDIRKSDNAYSIAAYSTDNDKDETISVNTDDKPDEVYKSLGQGFNLGNSLDACDWTMFGSSTAPDFQAAIVYNTNPWSTWDVSNYVSFDSNDEVEITWDLSSIKASNDSVADSFAIQLVNHKKAYEGTNVTCTVKSIKIEGDDGLARALKSNSLASHILTLTGDVTEFFYLDLKPYRLKTSDIKGKTITVTLQISNYYNDKASSIAVLEQSWGNPLISEEMIKTLKADGFDSVRIPVTWFNHISVDGEIDAEFLDRVEQVVDWVLGEDMYCIIDVHHDTGNAGWIKASEANYNQNKDKVYYIFAQIAERFKNKSNRLILEGLNETVNDKWQWGDIPAEDLEVMNKWNQLFVDAIRSTGGNNSNRYLLINTYAALPSDETFAVFKIPDDSAKNRIFVGVHVYIGEDDMDFWFDILERYCAEYPLIIGEWGINTDVADRVSHARGFVENAGRLGIPAFYWDNGVSTSMGIYNRDTMEQYYPDFISAIVGK